MIPNEDMFRDMTAFFVRQFAKRAAGNGSRFPITDVDAGLAR